MTNSIAFRPGEPTAIYMTQGSMSANGAPDTAWIRAEHQLNGAVLRVDLSAITSPPLNVQTEDGGTYDAFAAGAPVTVYASGVRNAFDLVFHSNGQLYAPTNGSAADGTTPSTPASLPAACARRIDFAANGKYTGPAVSGMAHIATAQSDFLFKVVAGGHYGHPNPQRCEWVLNGGNPTSATDPGEVPQYPVGVQPDRNYRGFAYDFGLHWSPNGAIEYRSNVFGSQLQGKLLVVRYSGGKDIIALSPGANGDIVGAQTGMTGMAGFSDPLDLTEDTASGNLYVTELAGQKITLLRPHPTGASALTVSAGRLVFTDIIGGSASAAQSLSISNLGSVPLTIKSLQISGTDAATFALASAPTLPATIAAGGKLSVSVTFNPTVAGPRKATLTVTADSQPLATVLLRGLGTRGTGGANEPSLQWIFDTNDIAVASGDPDPTTTDFPPPSTLLVGDEVAVPHFVRATAAPVTVEPLAVFGVASNPAVRVGWNVAGVASRKSPLFTVATADAQRLAPPSIPAGPIRSIRAARRSASTRYGPVSRSARSSPKTRSIPSTGRSFITRGSTP